MGRGRARRAGGAPPPDDENFPALGGVTRKLNIMILLFYGNGEFIIHLFQVVYET